MTEYLRVRDPDTGAEFTYDTAKVQALGLEGAVIKKEALGPDGLPAPTKPRLPLGEPLEGSAPSRRRAKKTAAQKAAPKKTTEATSPGEGAGQTSAALEQEN